MKTIILFRHGKSDWASDADDDHERPLAKRGKKAAALMGRYLAALGEVPDEAQASSAARAAGTLRRAVKAGAWTCSVATSRSLYDASPGSVVELIRKLDDARARVLLVGHEPTWSELLGALVGGARVQLPTAAMARIDFDIDAWAGVAPGGGTLIWLITPSVLSQIGWP